MKHLFVRRGGNTIGPLTIAQFKEAVASGKVAGTDHVAESSDGPWHPVAKVPFLQEGRSTDTVASREQELRQREQEQERQRQLLAQKSKEVRQEEAAGEIRLEEPVNQGSSKHLENVVQPKLKKPSEISPYQPPTSNDSGSVECPYCGHQIVKHVVYVGQTLTCQNCTSECTAPEKPLSDKEKRQESEWFFIQCVWAVIVVIFGIFCLFAMG